MFDWKKKKQVAKEKDFLLNEITSKYPSSINLWDLVGKYGLLFDKGKTENISFVSAYCDEFYKSGYLTRREITSSEPVGGYTNYSLRGEPLGFVFLNQDGGFIKSHNTKTLNHNWIIAKTAAAIGNALIIIFISYYATFKKDENTCKCCVHKHRYYNSIYK